MSEFKTTVIGIIVLGVISSLIATALWQGRDALDYFKGTLRGVLLLIITSSVVSVFVWEHYLSPGSRPASGQSQRLEQPKPASPPEDKMARVANHQTGTISSDPQSNDRKDKTEDLESHRSLGEGPPPVSKVLSSGNPPAPSQGTTDNSAATSDAKVANPADAGADAIVQHPPIGVDEQRMFLSRMQPWAERTATIIAPGPGLQEYPVFHIDTEDFINGGMIVVTVRIRPDSATDGSFDLFPEGFPIPTHGRPAGTLVGRYDVPRGRTTQFTYRFGRGQKFALGLEGNWGSPRGARGNVQFRVNVLP
jgi:hypothetical protein